MEGEEPGYFQDDDPDEWDDEADACDSARHTNSIRGRRRTDPDDDDDPDPDGDGGGDAPSPRGRSAARVANPSKTKEADTMKVAAFSDAVPCRSWKAFVRTEVTEAARPGRSDGAFIWILQSDGMPVNALGKPGEFESLDTKLAVGLMKAQGGELGRQLTVIEQAMAKSGLRLNGAPDVEDDL